MGDGQKKPQHPAARIEALVTAALDRNLRSRGFSPRVVAYTGYGATDWARVLARVILVPPGSGRTSREVRGWRRFAVTAATGIPVTIRIGSVEHVVTSDRDGYLDVRLACDLRPGWHEIELVVDGADPVPAPLRIVDPAARTGLLSDLDDTVIVTMLPQPLVAFRNAFLLREGARDPVAGMAALYGDLVAAHPGLFVAYLSTGAWNTAGPMSRFLQRHGFPAGPLLMTDWGPTTEGWFRSGQRHKREQLRRLFDEFPDVRWILVGDDGQHDPDLYAEAARDHPDRVAAVAIRQVRAPDGHGLREPLVAQGLLGD